MIEDPLVDHDAVQEALGVALRKGAEFAEVFVEDRRTTGISLDDRRVEELSSGRDRGAGIRVVVGETTGFAHTADLSLKGLVAAAEAASSVARSAQGGRSTVALEESAQGSPSSVVTLPEHVDKATKVA